MAEYIERKRAIVDACNSLELYPSEYAKLEDALNKIPAADVAPVQKWISAKERLPRDSDCVLVIASGKCENITFENAIEIATFDMSEGWILEMWPEWENPKITYWMPLPEPPKEDDDGK